MSYVTCLDTFIDLKPQISEVCLYCARIMVIEVIVIEDLLYLYSYLFILIQKGKFDSIENGEDASVIYFNKWTEQVKKNVPEDKLLIFDVKEGWNPLCKFLDLPIPNTV